MRTRILVRTLPLVGALVTGAWLVMPVAALQDRDAAGDPGATRPRADTTNGDATNADRDPVPVRYTALAIQRTVTPSRTVPVTITIERWSTEAERQKLYAALAEKGPEALLDTLRELPGIGRFSSPESVGYELHYASESVAPNGGRRVSLATNRWIGFSEATAGGRSLDYPFTLIELRIDADGEGEGKMSLATQVTLNKALNILTLENYENQPVLLQGVKRVDK